MHSIESLPNDVRAQVFEYMLRLADDRLVLGHRLSEWCGHAPFLEEDIALANIALDLIGQASHWLELAGRVEGQGRSADSLAYFRDTVQFKNAQLVERPRGDFAQTIARQFFFDVYSVLLLEALQRSTLNEIAALAARGLKEDTYHLRHSRQWMVRLGDGTKESNVRIQQALEEYWRFTGELFESDALSSSLAANGIGVDPSSLQNSWREQVHKCLLEATLVIPEGNIVMVTGGRAGLHSEFLDHLLTEMQTLARSYPDARW